MRDHLVGVLIAAIVLTLSYTGMRFLPGQARAQELDSSAMASLRAIEKMESVQDLMAVVDDGKRSVSERIAAIVQLGKLKKELEVTVPFLVKINTGGSHHFRGASEMAIATIGCDAVPYLKPFFEGKLLEIDPANEPELRKIVKNRMLGCSAAHVLGDCCDVYLPQIEELINSELTQARACALYALRGMNGSAEKLLDDVIECLKDSDFNNQCFACRIVRNLGPKAAAAEPTLQEILVDGLPSVRGWAGVCLGAIGPTPSTKENATVMGDRLEIVTPVEAQRLLTGLASMGKDAAHVKDKIREKMKFHDHYVQAHAAYALWKIDPDDPAIFDVLGKLLEAPGFEQDGLNMVIKMGPGAAPLLDKVAALSDSLDPITRDLVAIALGGMGPAAASKQDVLKQLTQDTDAMARVHAQKSLELIKPKK